MQPPFHARDFGGGPNPPARRQHRSSHSASSFRFTSHTSDAPSPTRDTSRQASFHLDFIVIGGGLFYL